MTRTTKYHGKRGYFGTSTAVRVRYVVYGTARTRMIHTKSILRILVSHDTGSVSRSLAGVRVPVSQNEDSLCTSSVRECNTSNTASTPNISGVCTAAAVDTTCAMCSGLCTASHILLVYQYEYVQGHCLSLETNVSVLA